MQLDQTVELVDSGMTPTSNKATSVKIVADSFAVGIQIDGLGMLETLDEDAELIYLAIEDGVPKLYVWADINEADPTHIIDLSSASISKRKDQLL